MVGYLTTETGDISGVTAGNGLTGGGTTGDVTLNIGTGTGISIIADSIGLDTTYTDGRYLKLGTLNDITGKWVVSTGAEDVDSFEFQTSTSTTGEKDGFTIVDTDAGGGSQDESSTLKVLRSGAFNTADDGSSLVELTYTGVTTGTDKQYYILGRTTDEGAVNWGVSMNDADIWTTGAIRAGATGTNCGGTNAACFNSPAFEVTSTGALSASSISIGGQTAATQTWVTSQNYLTSYTETDPIYSASASAGIVAGDITSWNTAYGWGDHGSVGYLTAEIDASTTNEIQTLGTSGNTITLTSGGSVTAPYATDADTVDGLHAAALTQQQTATALTDADDLNLISDGWHSWTTATGKPINAPGDYMALVQQSDPNQKIQMAFGSSGSGKIYIRRADSGTFYAWTEFQQRVSGTCAAGSSISGINIDGTVTCEIDTDTNTNAGTLCAAGEFLNGDGTCDTIAIDSTVPLNGNISAFLRKIQASDPQDSDNFGYSVAISGDRIVVGAMLEDTTASDAGSGYIYDSKGN